MEQEVARKAINTKEAEINLVRKSIQDGAPFDGMQGEELRKYLSELQHQHTQLVMALLKRGSATVASGAKTIRRKRGAMKAVLRGTHATLACLSKGGQDCCVVRHEDIGSPEMLSAARARRFLPSKSVHKHGYMIDLALRLCEMCDFVYFGKFWWESAQCQAGIFHPTKFSLKGKYYVGQLEKDWQDTSLRSPWGVRPLEFTKTISQKVGFKTVQSCIRGGVAEASSSDTQALLLECESRGEIIIIFRGTDNSNDAMLDAKILRKKNPYGHGSVHAGFLRAYQSIEDVIENAVSHTLNTNKAFKYIRIAGHSLGGALATLCALSLYNRYHDGVADDYDGVDKFPHISVYSFGSPMVGNKAFARDFDSKIPDSYRHVLDSDIVTMMPPRLCGYHHVQNLVLIMEFGMWIARRPIVITNKPDTTPGEDHSMTNYIRLLKRHRTVINMVQLDKLEPIGVMRIQKLQEAWSNILDGPMEARVISTAVARAASVDQSKALLTISQRKEPTINLKRLHEILVQDLNQDMAVASLIETEMRYLARGHDLDFSHLLAACFNLFFDQHAPQHRLWAYIRNVLEHYDLDDDKLLSPVEVDLALKHLHVDLSVTELGQMMSQADLDAGGSVSYTEFFVWLLMCMKKDIAANAQGASSSADPTAQTSTRFDWLFQKMKDLGVQMEILMPQGPKKQASFVVKPMKTLQDRLADDAKWMEDARPTAIASDSAITVSQDDDVNAVDAVEAMLKDKMLTQNLQPEKAKLSVPKKLVNKFSPRSRAKSSPVPSPNASPRQLIPPSQVP